MQNEYLNNLAKNHVLSTDTELTITDIPVMDGGNKIDITVPYGGFPPIYFYKDENVKSYVKDNKKQRAYIKQTDAVSIQDIMEKRKNIQPFI